MGKENDHLHRIDWTIESKLLMKPLRSIAGAEDRLSGNGRFQEQLLIFYYLYLCALSSESEKYIVIHYKPLNCAAGF